MSGGFFRGTSADQDTRFSNKQAKLLKSQKFPPELDNLVDITKVKMDVVRPWIATRVTELLGFEDEVLINFIYGLLDGKDINGKEVQIQLTGFMEKNTGKFMKELWCLLLSAQKNASGVPQQFLDAKEEEIRKKKEEADRITLEIQKKRELEQEKPKKMDGEVDITRSPSDTFDPMSKHLPPRAPGAHKQVDKASEERNGTRGNNRLSRSPLSADRAHSSERSSPRSVSKSFSNSRSYSGGRNKSRSISRSPPRRRSISPKRRYRSPRKRSMTPHRRHSPRRPRSPLRRGSPHSRRRSTSRSWRRSSSLGKRRSPSLVRRRSPSPDRRRSPPVRRRSPSPVRRRSQPPVRRRLPSPLQRESQSPVRRSSPTPMRQISPSPWHRRSPSPVQRRYHRRSPTPRRRSPSPLRRRSPSPMRRRLHPRSPRQRRRSPVRSPRQRNRSRSPFRSRSPVYRSRRSLSRDHEIQTNGVGSRRNRDDYASQRVRGKRSPVRNSPEREGVELSSEGRKALGPASRQPPISLRSPQRDPRNRSDGHKRVPVSSSLEKSPSLTESSPDTRKVIPRGDKRISSPSESPVRVSREQITRSDSANVSPVTARQRRDHTSRRDNSRTSGEEENSRARDDRGHRTFSPRKRTRHSPTVEKKVTPRSFNDEEYSPKISARDLPDESRAHHMDNLELRKKDRDKKSEKASVRAERPGISTQHLSHGIEVIKYGPGRIEGEISTLDEVPDERSLGKKRSRSRNYEGSVRDEKTAALHKSVKRVDDNDRITASDSYSEDDDKYRSEEMEKRKHKRGGRLQMASDDDASYDSQVDAKKEAKRKRKEEKRLRKEEKRRRREERHRKKEERRAGRLKAKSVDTVAPPSDIEKNQNESDDVYGDVAPRRESHPSDVEETEAEQKKLEIELRKKALESLRAKKAVNP